MSQEPETSPRPDSRASSPDLAPAMPTAPRTGQANGGTRTASGSVRAMVERFEKQATTSDASAATPRPYCDVPATPWKGRGVSTPVAGSGADVTAPGGVRGQGAGLEPDGDKGEEGGTDRGSHEPSPTEDSCKAGEVAAKPGDEADAPEKIAPSGDGSPVEKPTAESDSAAPPPKLANESSPPPADTTPPPPSDPTSDTF